MLKEIRFVFFCYDLPKHYISDDPFPFGNGGDSLCEAGMTLIDIQGFSFTGDFHGTSVAMNAQPVEVWIFPHTGAETFHTGGGGILSLEIFII